MDLTKGIEKIKEWLGKLKGAGSFLWSKAFSPVKGHRTKNHRSKDDRAEASQVLGNMSAFLNGKIDALTDRFLGRFPAEKRRSMLFALGGLVALLLILVISVLMANFRGPKESTSVDMSAVPVIPPQELFIPGEPDFLPEFLLEREPRRSWSLEDIRPYWRSPADSKRWREEIKSAVDKLMEVVP